MLLFNPKTEQQLANLANDLPQGILLQGSDGAGLLTTAQHLAAGRVAAIIEPVDKDGAPNHTKGTISVKRIRELYEQTRGKSLTQQVYIIDDADKMSPGAQNAFLKLLEEPNSQVYFILTSHHSEALLPTIRSRIEAIHITPITKSQSEQLLIRHKLPAAQQAQALFVAAGKPAELARMAQSADYFAAKAATMSAAKQLVSGNKVQRVVTAYSYSSDREQALALLAAAISIVKFSGKSAAAIQQLDRFVDAYDAIAANGNTKLHLLAAVI